MQIKKKWSWKLHMAIQKHTKILLLKYPLFQKMYKLLKEFLVRWFHVVFINKVENNIRRACLRHTISLQITPPRKFWPFPQTILTFLSTRTILRLFLHMILRKIKHSPYDPLGRIVRAVPIMYYNLFSVRNFLFYIISTA